MVRQLAIVDPYSPAPRQISAAAEVRGALAVCALLEAPSRPWHVIHVPTGLVISRHRAYAAAWPAASWYMALAAELGLDLAAITSVDDPARAHFQAAMIAREPPDGTRWAAAPGPHGAQRTTVRASDEEASVTTQMIDLDSYHVLLDGAGEDIGARQIAATALACAAGRAWIERSADDTTIRDALAAAGAAFEQLAGLAEAAPSAAFDAMLGALGGERSWFVTEAAQRCFFPHSAQDGRLADPPGREHEKTVSLEVAPKTFDNSFPIEKSSPSMTEPVMFSRPRITP